MKPVQHEAPTGREAEPAVPPEVEEMLAAMYRPRTAQELFSAGGPSPKRVAEVREKIREVIKRHESGESAASSESP